MVKVDYKDNIKLYSVKEGSANTKYAYWLIRFSADTLYIYSSQYSQS
jgi:hypothetical protein